MFRHFTIGVLLAVLVSGCAMKAYEGPERPKSEIAELRQVHQQGVVLKVPFGPGLLTKHVATIIEIDGKSVTFIWTKWATIHILPGQHSVRVFYLRFPDVALCGDGGCIANYTTGDLSIDFTAEAGHEYRIPAERRDERNWIWVEDKTTGKVVAGEKPPATPPE